MADAELYVGVTLKGTTELSADRLVVRHFTGNEDDVLIFKRDGKRHIGQIRRTMGIRSPTRAVEAAATIYEHVEELDEDDRKRLLAIYDKFERRTQR